MNKAFMPNYNYSSFYLRYFDGNHCTALDPTALPPLIILYKMNLHYKSREWPKLQYVYWAISIVKLMWQLKILFRNKKG
ncbi:hypothetical protein C7Y70_05535 [Pseudoalteromonas sp. KS88]|nr:hypothetical protein C7Y70_05535 [Pseudoalteromonas sp. KS88]